MKSINRRLLLAAAVLFVFAVILCGCGSDKDSVAAESNTAEAATGYEVTTGESENYEYIAYCTSVPYWLDGRRGLDKACELLGVSYNFSGPVEFDAQAQARAMEEAIAKGVDGIILSPADPDVLAGPSEKAIAAGIPVVMVISDVNSKLGEGSYGWLGGLNYNVGVSGGTFAAEELLNKKGKVGILTMPGVTVHEERKAGYVDTFAKYPDIDVVEIVDTRADPAIGLDKAAAIIQKHPDLKLLIGTDSVGGAAAARAVQEAGKVGEIFIIGMDRDQDLLNYIKDGVVTATIASKSFTTKFMALHYLYWINHDIMQDAPDWRKAGINPVPTITDTGNMVINQDNVDLFLK